jgi:hypothetical protein
MHSEDWILTAVAPALTWLRSVGPDELGLQRNELLYGTPEGSGLVSGQKAARL